MYNNISFLSYLLFYFFIFYSVVGYGLFFSKILNKNSTLNLGYLGIYGLFFLALYSYISHHFFSHSLIHNLILILLGFCCYLILFFYSYKKYLINHLLLFLIVSLIFISSLLAKTHDDFPYYHFAYTYFLTQHSSIFGIGLLNGGFRTTSSIFYIGSLFYLPIIKYFTFHFVAVFILVFTNYIFASKILNFYKKKDFNFIFYLCLLCFLFINIIFYRIGEHGTDRSAQILVLLLITEILAVINLKNYYVKNYSICFILIGLIVTFKAFFIFYSVFIIYLLFFLLKKISIKEVIFNNLNFYACCLIILCSFFVSFQNSGCFLYPVVFTCVEDFDWSINKSEVILLSNWFELWSKAGAGPNLSVENPDFYIKGINWVMHWIQNYAYPKVSNTILGILSICIVVFSIFYNKLQRKKFFRSYRVIMIIIFLLFVEWFFKHPALRYGGFCIIALLFFIPLSLRLELYQTHLIMKKIILLLILTILIFYGRNINRIIKESKYNYQPFVNPTYIVKNNYFKVPLYIDNLILNFNNCKKMKSDCNLNLSPKVGLFLNKYYFYKK